MSDINLKGKDETFLYERKFCLDVICCPITFKTTLFLKSWRVPGAAEKCSDVPMERGSDIRRIPEFNKCAD